MSLDRLFEPFDSPKLGLPNRVVMAPMTRYFSPGGIPGKDVANYYAARAAGGVGLIITEGIATAHYPVSANNARVPILHGEAASDAWRQLVSRVHETPSRIAAQLWHVGIMRKPSDGPEPGVPGVSPSGLLRRGKQVGEPMSLADIDAAIEGYLDSARRAVCAGFDAIEIHAAHGYLIDQFFWDGTNQRGDRYGGDIAQRTRFACELLAALRAEVGKDFPIILRYSQWKQQDYAARLADNPAELEAFLNPLVNAGVDLFHCSTRRFWEPEFPGSDLNLAGWTQKITGLPAITVGSIGLDLDFVASLKGETSALSGLDQLAERLARDEFSLVAIGRMLIANPDWANRLRSGAEAKLIPYAPDMLQSLV